MSTFRPIVMAALALALPLPAGASPEGDSHGEHAAPRPPASRPAARPEPRADAKPEPKTPLLPPPRAAEPKAEPRPARTSPRTEAKPDLKPDAKPDTKPEADPAPRTPEEALAALRQGNDRWAAGKPLSPRTDAARRAELAAGQKPFASVLTCSDSRVPAERLFDQGVGDVFVVRVAGNLAQASETGTIEYGVGHLKTPLLVVMGHTKCGAVAAAAAGGSGLHGKVAELVGTIGPAVERAKRLNPGASKDELAAAAVRENVWQSVYELLRSSPELAAAARDGSLTVVGAVYDIASGKVEWLGEHPWQGPILEALAGPRSPAAPATAQAKE